MDQGDAVVCAAVLEHRFLIPQRDLELALGFIVRNGIAMHAARSVISLADSTRMPGCRMFFSFGRCLKRITAPTLFANTSSLLLQPAAWLRHHISYRP